MNDFLQKLNIPCVVFDINNNIVSTNSCFVQEFGNIDNLNRFKNKFDFDFCVLDPEKNINLTPIDFCLISNENFFAVINYRSDSSNFKFYELNSYVKNKEKILTFKNLTYENKFQELNSNFIKLEKTKNNLELENKKLNELKDTAQLQVLKMNILNRINDKIRKSIDYNEIILSALKEICPLINAFTISFAKFERKGIFKVTHIYPRTKSVLSHDTKFVLSDNEFEKLSKRKYMTTIVLKPFEKSDKIFKSSLVRITIPIFHQKKLLGIIIGFSKQKVSLSNQSDLISSLAVQISQACSLANLFDKVKSTNKELKKTLNELKETQIHLINSEKMASLGQLIAGVAHEINTPLASVNSNNNIRFKILDKIYEKDENNDLIQKLQHINKLDEEAIKRIKNIVISLKKFVRLDEAQLQSVNVNDEIDLTLELLNHELKNKITVVKNYSNVNQIKCYPNLLNQVFMNLIMNAKQSIQGFGKIEISTLMNENNLEIIFKDTGCGIAKKNINKIFNQGFTTKPYGEGTGLGLAICKKIIEKHNGNITFKSEINVGTQFKIVLPYS